MATWCRSRSSCRGGAVIEHVPWWSPLVGYALGWLAGRLDRETQDDPRRRFNHENRRGPVGPPPLKLRRSGDPGAIRPTTPKPEIIPKPQYPPARYERWFINNPATIAECGGPCTAGPKHCDCGALWVDVLK